MTGTDPGTVSGNAGPPSAPAKGRTGDEPAPAWLLRQKIAVPESVAGNVERAALAERVMPTRRNLTVLKAPGGFGKTTLLAECCRRLRADGVPVA